MSVTFGTPVFSTTGAVALSGVSLGQPIILVVEFAGPSNTISDSFASPYTWTQVDQVNIYSSSSGRTVYKTSFIGTGGYGSSGTITVASASIATAVAAIGASGASGLSAIDVHGSSSGNSLTISSPSLTPSTTGKGAVCSALAVEEPGGASITSGPTSPWTNTIYAPYGYGFTAVATYPSPPASALATSWTQTNSFGAPDTNYLSVGLVLTAFTATAPSAPTNNSPNNASYQDVSGGLTFSAVYNPTDNVPQSHYGLRLKSSGGTYGYWNGTDFSSTSVVQMVNTALPGQAFSVVVPNGVVIPGGTFVDGTTYNWSFCSYESASNIQGSFAGDFTLIAQAGPATTVSTPTGTVHGTTLPTVGWSSTFPSGPVQTEYQIIVESGSYGTTPGSGVTAWNSGVVASSSTLVVVGTALSPGLSYCVFVQVTETGPEVGAWAYNTFTLQVDTPTAPTVTALAINDPTTGLPEVQITVQGNDNQLTANQSSLESDATTGWAAGANTTIAASATWVQDGSYSLRMTASASGTVSATTPTGTSGVVCSPGEVIRALASLSVAMRKYPLVAN